MMQGIYEDNNQTISSIFFTALCVNMGTPHWHSNDSKTWVEYGYNGIMVNMGRTQSELGKFLMISSNLIKSDDESMIEIRKFDILRKLTRRQIHRVKNH